MSIELNGMIGDFLEGSIKTIGKVPVINQLSVTENGTYTAPSGVDGYSPVVVNVPELVLNSININENGSYTPPTGVDGYNSINVNVPTPQPVLQTLNVSNNGRFTPPTGVDGYNVVDVEVVPDLRGITFTENGTFIPSGYDGFSEVIVNVPTNAPNIIMQDRVLMQSQGGSVQINYDDSKTLETDKYYLFAFKLLANNGQYYYQNFILKWSNQTTRLDFNNYFSFSIDVYGGFLYITFTSGAVPYTFNGKITELNNTFIYN